MLVLAMFKRFSALVFMGVLIVTFAGAALAEGCGPKGDLPCGAYHETCSSCTMEESTLYCKKCETSETKISPLFGTTFLPVVLPEQVTIESRLDNAAQCNGKIINCKGTLHCGSCN